jgi:hypothetical protein
VLCVLRGGRTGRRTERMGVALACRMHRAGLFLLPPYQAYGERIKRALRKYDAGLNPARAASGYARR